MRINEIPHCSIPAVILRNTGWHFHFFQSHVQDTESSHHKSQYSAKVSRSFVLPCQICKSRTTFKRFEYFCWNIFLSILLSLHRATVLLHSPHCTALSSLHCTPLTALHSPHCTALPSLHRTLLTTLHSPYCTVLSSLHCTPLTTLHSPHCTALPSTALISLHCTAIPHCTPGIVIRQHCPEQDSMADISWDRRRPIIVGPGYDNSYNNIAITQWPNTKRLETYRRFFRSHKLLFQKSHNALSTDLLRENAQYIPYVLNIGLVLWYL